MNFGLSKDLANVAEEYRNKIANAMSKVSPNPLLVKKIRKQMELLNSIDLARIEFNRIWTGEGGIDEIINPIEQEISCLECKIDNMLKDTLNLVTDILMSEWEGVKSKKSITKRTKSAKMVKCFT